jgi:hypothetical protein
MMLATATYGAPPRNSFIGYASGYTGDRDAIDLACDQRQQIRKVGLPEYLFRHRTTRYVLSSLLHFLCDEHKVACHLRTADRPTMLVTQDPEPTLGAWRNPSEAVYSLSFFLGLILLVFLREMSWSCLAPKFLEFV